MVPRALGTALSQTDFNLLVSILPEFHPVTEIAKGYMLFGQYHLLEKGGSILTQSREQPGYATALHFAEGDLLGAISAAGPGRLRSSHAIEEYIYALTASLASQRCPCFAGGEADDYEAVLFSCRGWASFYLFDVCKSSMHGDHPCSK